MNSLWYSSCLLRLTVPLLSLSLCWCAGAWKLHGETGADLPRKPGAHGPGLGSGAGSLLQGGADPEHGPRGPGDHHGGAADMQAAQETGVYAAITLCSLSFLWLEDEVLVLFHLLFSWHLQRTKCASVEALAAETASQIQVCVAAEETNNEPISVFVFTFFHSLCSFCSRGWWVLLRTQLGVNVSVQFI